jgi:hypothetical protein
MKESKKIILVSLFVFLGLILVWLGYQQFIKWQITKRISDDAVLREVQTRVENYIQLTLRSVPGIPSEYDEAKKYLTDDLAAQFYGPGFVPESYCIQNIPTEVAVKSIKVFAGQAAVKIDARFGEEWRERWKFILIKDKGTWKINKIKCL